MSNAKTLKLGDTYRQDNLTLLKPSQDSSKQVIPSTAATLTHVQFRRFAGCPICDTHLRSFVTNKEKLDKAGVEEVIIFHSTIKELEKYEVNLPFTVVADPNKKLYSAIGLEPKMSKFFKFGNLKSLPSTFASTIFLSASGQRQMPPTFEPTGGRFGTPADILVSSQGTVLDLKYGEHPNDQWPLETVLEKATKLKG